MNDVNIFYIGNKPVKKDTVAGSRLSWTGFGSARVVEQKIAQRLVAFPTVWVDEQTFQARYANVETAAEDNAALVELPVVDVAADDADVQAQDSEQIQAAIRRLERGNPEHFGASGAPKIDAVRAQLPENFALGAKELNSAFADIRHEFRG